MGEEREEERGGRRKGDSGEELKEKGPAKKVDFFLWEVEYILGHCCSAGLRFLAGQIVG